MGSRFDGERGIYAGDEGLTPTDAMRVRKSRRLSLLHLVATSIVAAVGGTLTVTTGYLILRGPFLGGAPLTSDGLMWSLAGFVAGIILLALGSTKVERLLFR